MCVCNPSSSYIEDQLVMSKFNGFVLHPASLDHIQQILAFLHDQLFTESCSMYTTTPQLVDIIYI